MANYKTVPNQKVVKVNKEKCDKQNLYAAINIAAMEQAAQKLDAGAFKLWCYFAKNQNGYEFALSSKEVLDTFGMKIKQYSNAVDNLVALGYLVNCGGNRYSFNEIAVITKEDNEENSLIPKGNNAVITKKDNAVITKSNNQLFPQEIRNNTNTTLDNTKDNTMVFVSQPQAAEETKTLTSQKETEQKAQVLTAQEAMAKYGITACANRVSAGVAGCCWIAGDLVKLV